jgi:hypothetical protein
MESSLDPIENSLQVAKTYRSDNPSFNYDKKHIRNSSMEQVTPSKLYNLEPQNNTGTF